MPTPVHFFNLQFPLWVISGHSPTFGRCPLYAQKRTLELTRVMSALCQKQTYAVQHKIDKRSPRRCVEMVPIRDPPLAVRQSVWNAVSAFDVATLASMSWGLRHGSQ